MAEYTIHIYNMSTLILEPDVNLQLTRGQPVFIIPGAIIAYASANV